MIVDRKRLLFSTLVMALLSQTPAEASTGLWAKLMVDAQRNHQDAARYLAAVRVAEKFGAHDPRLHVALSNAAHALRIRNPALAESFFKRDIADLESINWDFPEIPLDCYELANLYLRQRRYAECEALLKRAIAIRNNWRVISSNEPFNAELFASLYLDYYSQGDAAKAAEAYDQMNNSVRQLTSLRRRSDCLGTLRYHIYAYAQDQPGLSQRQARHLNEVALTLAAEEADCLQRRGDPHLCADQLYRSAAIAFALGDMNKAEGMLRESLELIRNKLDPDEEIALLRLDTGLLSKIFCTQHRYEDAEALQEKFVSDVARVYGLKSNPYVHELRNWAGFWQSANQLELAKEWQRRAQEIQRRLH